jgi:hypothetical protein
VSKDRAFTREAAAKSGKPSSRSGVAFTRARSKAEIEGKDTVLMLIRDMTVAKTYAS